MTLLIQSINYALIGNDNDFLINVCNQLELLQIFSTRFIRRFPDFVFMFSDASVF